MLPSQVSGRGAFADGRDRALFFGGLNVEPSHRRSKLLLRLVDPLTLLFALLGIGAVLAAVICTSGCTRESSGREDEGAIVIPVEPLHTTALVYEVRRGDTLWRIAEKQLGSGARWREIASANGISNPSRLRIGANLSIPEQAR